MTNNIARRYCAVSDSSSPAAIWSHRPRIKNGAGT